MMLYPAMSELLEQVPSRYKLVNVVAARARKIAAKAERENTIREIAAGHLDDLEEEPAAEAEETPLDAEPETPSAPEGEDLPVEETEEV